MKRPLHSHHSLLMSAMPSGLLAALGGALLSASCSHDGERGDQSTRTLRVVVAENETGGERFGLAGDEPVFIGLGVSEGASRKTHVLKRGDNEVQISVGEGRVLEASLLTYRPESPHALL